jgi:2-isopropylmalate synthase
VWEIPYLPIDPKDLGRSYEAVIRVNSQSGKGGISYLLEAEYGIELPRRLQIEFSQIVQQVMDTNGKELGAADLWQIFDREYGVKQAPALQPQIGITEDGQTQVTAQADLCVRMVKVQGQGKGPIDAFVEGLNRVLQTQVRVLDYHEHALGSGADAQAVAYLELRVGEHTLFGVGMDGNIASASLKAIVSGLRRAAQRGQLKLVRLQAA